MEASVIATAALTRQAISLEVLKQSMEMQRQIVDMLAQAVENVPVSPSRGTNLNISA